MGDSHIRIQINRHDDGYDIDDDNDDSSDMRVPISSAATPDTDSNDQLMSPKNNPSTPGNNNSNSELNSDQFSISRSSILSGGIDHEQSEDFNDDFNDQNSFVSTSFRPSFETNATLSNYLNSSNNYNYNNLNLSLNNNITSTSVSPLGPNSIYELISGSDLKRRKNKMALFILNNNFRISLGPPTKIDIPTIKLTNSTAYEKVDDDQFTDYLNTIQKEFNKFENNRKLTQSTLQTLSSLNNSYNQNQNDIKTGTINHTNTSSIIADNISLIKKNVNFNDLNSIIENKNDLANVPLIFFQPDFRLDNPRTFNKVIENSQILSSQQSSSIQLSTKKYLANNSLLQEKLSWYLDIIEIHLINEISNSSDSFFNTLDELSLINSKSKNSIEILQKIEDNLNDIKKKQLVPGKSLLNLIQKRKNIQKLEQSLLQIQLILNLKKIADFYFYNSSYIESLYQIETIQSLILGNIEAIKSNQENKKKNKIINNIYKWPYELLNLDQLPALNNLKADLSTLKKKIGTSYINLFLDFLITDLRNHYENMSYKDTLIRILSNFSKELSMMKRHSRSSSLNKINLINEKKKINRSYLILDQDFRQLLKEYILGLIKCNRILIAFQNYEERLIIEFKNIIKFHLPTSTNSNAIVSETNSVSSRGSDSKMSSSTSLSNFSNRNRSLSQLNLSQLNNLSQLSLMQNQQQSGNQILIDYIRTMTPKDFEVVLFKIYADLSEALRRLTTHQKILLDTALDSIVVPESQQQDFGDLIMKLDISKTIEHCVLTVQKRMAKIITIRQDLNIQTSVEFFIRFYLLNYYFLVECENINISGSMKQNYLKNCIEKHVKHYGMLYHKNSIRKIAIKIDKETWKEYRVDSENHKLLEEIMQSADSEPQNWSRLLDLEKEFIIDEDTKTEEETTLVSPNHEPINDVDEIIEEIPLSKQNGDLENSNLVEEETNEINKGTDNKKIDEEIDGKEIENKINKKAEDVNSDLQKETTADLSDDNQYPDLLKIDDKSFIIPVFIIDTLELIKDYMLLIGKFPEFQVSYESNILDLIKMINTKSNQAVLGAGATRTSSLKHITVKHLAICSQSLDFLISLLPYINKFFLRCNNSLPSQNSMNKKYDLNGNSVNGAQTDEKSNIENEVDKTRELLQSHQNEIFTKLISIMNDRVIARVNEIKQVDWSQLLPSSSPCHRYMELLVKDITTISRVLCKNLPELQYSFILSQIFDNYKRKVLEEYTRVEFNDEIEKSIMMKDIDYFRVRCSDLPGYSNSGQVIWETVNSMKTKEDKLMEEKMKQNQIE
ncbi:Vps54p [Ascoidea rubescens DSM 1968]|uniref:Vps54-domain-containing protein n=1 Tax=Ascoidea rubescens DSM 1968 TaxID=1344418 RepID=A0A1D2VPT7_9ASCO|nr:Vps54-domain-containing protein [Ascoidea rubescens DSM 1968]ODV63618.1 Vps54-domain-containing protein [Ascoidea rubescens DSM 1968]